jgi:hypothetical protein
MADSKEKEGRVYETPSKNAILSELSNAPKSPAKEPLKVIVGRELRLDSITAIGYCNSKNCVVSPSSYNYIGDFCIGNCILDSGCSTLLLKVDSTAVLDQIFDYFPASTWNFRIGEGIGISGKVQTLIVTHNAKEPVPVYLARDICESAIVGYAPGYRFHLCDEDVETIMNDERKRSRNSLATELIRTNNIPRLCHSLIGAAILKQSIGLWFPEIVFFTELKKYAITGVSQAIDLSLICEDARDLFHNLQKRMEQDLEQAKLDSSNDFIFNDESDFY